jgi:hypothetical protein
MKLLLAMAAALSLASCAEADQQAAQNPQSQAPAARAVPAYQAPASTLTTNCSAGGLSYSCRAY